MNEDCQTLLFVKFCQALPKKLQGKYRIGIIMAVMNDSGTIQQMAFQFAFKPIDWRTIPNIHW